MTDFSSHRIDTELARIEDRLRASRVEATAFELDELKLRAKRQAVSAAPTYRKGTFMKSRLALTLTLVLGLMMSGTGATLAVDGIGNDDSASTSVYPREKGTEEGGGTVLGNEEVAGAEQGVQPTAQVAAGEGGTLPFTGFVAIPLLVGGVALLGTGAVVRLRTRREQA
jgi:hypothetical protein